MSKNKLPIPMRWWFAGLTATLGGLAGLIGSIYASEIVVIQPFIYLKNIPYVPLVLFILFLFLFGLLFGYGFRAQVISQDDSANLLNDSVAEAKNTFQTQIKKLEETVRTLPPDNFLAKFEDQFMAAYTMTADALACTEEDNLQEKLNDAIITCLAAIVNLAVAYDKPKNGTVYTASIMLMQPIPSGEAELLKLRNELQMFESTTDLSTLEGYLESHAFFSFGSQTFPETPASQIKLPVPKEAYRKDQGGSTILPGAPAAWCSPAELQYIPNVKMMLDSLKLSGLRPVVYSAASEYFQTHPLGSQVKSFISFSFGIPRNGPGQVYKNFGVINLHSTAEGLLDTRRIQLYGPLTQPVRALLSMLWQRWIEKGYK